MDIHFQGDSFSSNGALQLTKNAVGESLRSSAGRVTSRQLIPLWDSKTGELSDFTTHFTFTMKAANLSEKYGDGMTFFLSPENSQIPAKSTGGYLALFSPDSALNADKGHQIVAVEFDSSRNDWDPSDDHVGINVNSIRSVKAVNWQSSIKDGRTANAWINYNSTTKNLSVFLTYAENPVYNGSASLSYTVDLREFLPEFVTVGFSASTGISTQIHNVFAWDFDSTLEKKTASRNSGLAIGLGLGFGLGLLVIGIGGFLFWRIRINRRNNDGGDDQAFEMDDEFEKGTGPKRFSYRELSRATANFSDSGKLGEGGFGGVYKGILTNSGSEIAVKRVSRTSRQGKKEYISEVRIISRLRHRNLVQLIGWCHEKNELLLVYEFLPNGSLDQHLFSGERSTVLDWPVRYKIALGLASGLLYLHEEWEQCVVHRDIKSSNVMLDSNFNAKLGDFGLARLVDHELGSQTTVLAGTMGYLAPECVTTGKASKESDVYSFGVVALEIACGRKPVDPKQELRKVRLVEWVWDLYGKGEIMEAVDWRMTAADGEQVERLMIIGLWCCHPDEMHRPSIRQVISVLKMEAALPSLPAKLPVPMYYAPPLDITKFGSNTTSSGNIGAGKTGVSQTSYTTTTTSSSAGSAWSGDGLLVSQKSSR
ncbi:L-type lectin-domain containing receptor kinase IX.1 [Linum perenne]